MLLKIKTNIVVLIDDEDYEKVKNYKFQFGGTGRGYIFTRINNKFVPIHRLIIDVPKGMVADHVSGDTLDNRKCNLRIATQSQNRMNSVKQTYLKKETTSKFKGVHKKHPKRKWSAAISFKGVRYHLGDFNEETEAAMAYDKKAKELFGEFAKLNFG